MAICIDMGKYKSLTLSKRNKLQNIKFKNRQNQMIDYLDTHIDGKIYMENRHDLIQNSETYSTLTEMK